MSVEVNKEGSYRGQITSYGLFEADSGAVALKIEAQVVEVWEDGEWKAYPQDAEVVALGSIWLIKKDGSLNTPQIEALVGYCEWDGDLASLVRETWKPTPCSFVVNHDEYKGVERYKISWVNAFDSSPSSGAAGNVDDIRGGELALTHSAALRAIAGNVKRNANPVVPPADVPF